MDLPHFPLFPHPENEGTFEETDLACEICGKHSGVRYAAALYSSSESLDSEETVICPWCISNGSAGAKGLTFNDVSTTSQMTVEDKEIVEQRTPGFVTWQGNHWLACCGRACVFLGEADAADLQGRWAAVVPNMFDGNTLSQEEADEFIRSLAHVAGPGVYVFECQVCHALKGYWDCD